MENPKITINSLMGHIADELAGYYTATEITGHIHIIIEHYLGIDRSLLHLKGKEEPNIIHVHAINDCLSQLKQYVPIQYITGEAWFYDLNLKLNNATLIPRPETEELVHLIIKENYGNNVSILDIGTGSGCIALALAANIPGAKVTAIDISLEALEIAITNANALDLNVDFYRDDILNPSELLHSLQFEIIVSNPPYVRLLEKELMHINVLEHEPHTALFVPDDDALIFYRSILDYAKTSLLPGGKIYFEINEAMENEIKQLLLQYGYQYAEVIPDINGKPRIAKAIKPV